MVDRKPKILCADDDEGWQALLSLWLRPHCELGICASGAEVLARVQGFRPDCIVLDYELGDARGSDICARIKAQPDLSATPVVILTNLAPSLFSALKEGGADHFVVKSAQPDELLAVLEGLLGARGFATSWSGGRP